MGKIPPICFTSRNMGKIPPICFTSRNMGKIPPICFKIEKKSFDEMAVCRTF
jgi:hypothetical protein